MILFSIPYNHVLESDTKKEPYWNRIRDTRFYVKWCIEYLITFLYSINL